MGVNDRLIGMAQQTTADDRTAADLNTADWDSDEWAEFNAHPSENNHYVSTTGSITRHCPRCGYEGTHDHPRRSRPTFHADLTHHCPDAKCGARLHSGSSEDCEDCDHEDDEQEQEVATDGGQEMQNALAAERQMVQENSEQPTVEDEQEGEGSQHTHDSVWAAALNLETHEDGRNPRLGVEYRQKNGNGTSRYAGTVERVEVERPEQHFGQDVGQPEVRVVFQRDDGQRMYVTPEGLYTVGSHAPYVGSPVTLTTSTTNTVALPEASGEGSSEDDGDDSPTASAPRVDSLEALAEWVERQGSDLHAEVGSTHYSWDIPGFGRQNDPHSGRTAKRGGECAYVEVRGPRSDRVEQALAALAHQENLEVSASSHRATLVPPAGW